MAMNVGSGSSITARDPEVMIDINTTPLIDVMLVLLVMLIITLPIQLHSVNLNMPLGNPPPPKVLPEVVKIDIDPSDTIYWNGVAVPDRATLEDKIRAAAAEPVQPEIHLRPDKNSHYATAAEVMASAQRLGLTKIGIVGSEQFIEE
jgi:biopolymer transport protein ExbD